MTEEESTAVDALLVRRLTTGRIRPGVIDGRLIRASAERRAAVRDRLPILARLVRRAAPPAGAAPSLPRVRAVPVAAPPAGESPTTTTPAVVVGARWVRGDDHPALFDARSERRSPAGVLPQAEGATGHAAARGAWRLSVTGAGAVGMGLPADTGLPTGTAGTAPPVAAQTALPLVGVRTTRSAAAGLDRSADGLDTAAGRASGLPDRGRPAGRLTAARPRPTAGSDQRAARNGDAADGRSGGSAAVPVVRARRPGKSSAVRAAPDTRGAQPDVARPGVTRGSAAAAATSGAPDRVLRAAGVGSAPPLPLVRVGRTGVAARPDGDPRPVRRALGGRSPISDGGAAASAGRSEARPSPTAPGHGAPAPHGAPPVPAVGTVVQAKRPAPSRAADVGVLDPATAEQLVDRVLRRLRRDIAVQAERRGVGP